jgi:ribosomal protein L40E
VNVLSLPWTAKSPLLRKICRSCHYCDLRF